LGPDRACRKGAGGKDIAMPKLQPKQHRPQQCPFVPICTDCNEEMIPVLTVPLKNAAEFEDVFYECPVCRFEMKLTSIPI